MSYLSEAFLISVLWIFHTSFSLYIYITMYAQALYRILTNIIGRRHDEGLLLSLRDSLEKIPRHIAFIFLENNLDYRAIASLVMWSLVLGVENISLYDLEGRIKQNQDKLLLAINQKLQAAVSREPCCIVWRPHTDSLSADSTVIVAKNGAMYPDVNGNGRIQVNGTKTVNGTVNTLNGTLNKQNGTVKTVNGTVKMVNGTVNVVNGTVNGSTGVNGKYRSEERTISISLLSGVDGKGDIARCARDLSSRVGLGRLQTSQITEDLISSLLHTNQTLPDPSLVVRLGILQSNMEFLPWQLRLSEIHSIDSTLGLSINQFTDVIKKYSRCEQRLGK